MQSTGAEVRVLLRSLLRQGRNFPSYNIREYIQRRAVDGFRLNSTADATAQPALLAQARSDLEMIKRQALVYGLFGQKIKNVLELDQAASNATRRRTGGASGLKG